MPRFILVLLFMIPVFCNSQHHRFFYGTVKDAVKNRAIRDVNLVVEATGKGTSTNRNGEFSFFTDSLPAILTVSHLGYKTKRILLDETSYSLMIYLEQEAVVLGEVEIRVASWEGFYHDQQLAVLDYEPDSGMIYILAYRGAVKNATLICKSEAGDTIARSQPLWFRPSALFRDCTGILHVLGSDSGYQVFRQDSVLHLIHPVHLRKFDDVLKNCVAMSGEILYFKKETNRGLGTEYFGVNRKTLQKKTVTQLSDEKKMAMLSRNQEDAMLMRSSIPESRDAFVTWNFAHKILYRPLKSSLFTVKGYTAIVNVPGSQIEFYDGDGNYSYKLHIETEGVTDGRWTGEVFPDKRTGKVYTTYLRNGILSLFRIDLNTGKLIKSIQIVHLYPQKVKIANGFVYYLHDDDRIPDNTVLIRQQL
jgi:hypothetical protein